MKAKEKRERYFVITFKLKRRFFLSDAEGMLPGTTEEGKFLNHSAVLEGLKKTFKGFLNKRVNVTNFKELSKKDFDDWVFVNKGEQKKG